MSYVAICALRATAPFFLVTFPPSDRQTVLNWDRDPHVVEVLNVKFHRSVTGINIILRLDRPPSSSRVRLCTPSLSTSRVTPEPI